jgi:hypothetical protein
MARIAISYRRSDTSAFAGRLRDKLALHFGEDAVFMDIDDIPLGVDFREHIKATLDRTDVVLVVVGPHWTGGEGGKSRIHEAADPCRVEVEVALARRVPVIPVLVNGTPMPKAETLPPSIADFSFRNAAEISDGRDFHQQADRLIRSIETGVGAGGAAVLRKASIPWRKLGVGAVAAAGLAALAVGAIVLVPTLRPMPPSAPTAATPTPVRPAPESAGASADAAAGGVSPFASLGRGTPSAPAGAPSSTAITGTVSGAPAAALLAKAFGGASQDEASRIGGAAPSRPVGTIGIWGNFDFARLVETSADGASVDAVFRRASDKTWVEADRSGTTRNRYAEVSHVEREIVLFDSSRDLYLRFDLAQSRAYARRGPTGAWSDYQRIGRVER